MDKVCVITGGGSGMGLATARIVGKDALVVLSGRSPKKLEAAAAELGGMGIEALPFACDLAVREAAEALAEFAAGRGRIASVIHAAGMSPHMGDARRIMEANALGTVNVNDAFFPVMGEGSCLVDVSSMSAHIAPRAIMPERHYPLARADRERFMRRMMGRVALFPPSLRPSAAYGISKHFVVWFAKTDAARFGAKGARVVSVSPGSFETPMGELEREEASAYVERCAIKRFGKVEEIARLLAAVADEGMGYLTGADIICDGGLVASGRGPARRRKAA